VPTFVVVGCAASTRGLRGLRAEREGLPEARALTARTCSAMAELTKRARRANALTDDELVDRRFVDSSLQPTATTGPLRGLGPPSRLRGARESPGARGSRSLAILSLVFWSRCHTSSGWTYRDSSRTRRMVRPSRSSARCSAYRRDHPIRVHRDEINAGHRQSALASRYPRDPERARCVMSKLLEEDSELRQTDPRERRLGESRCRGQHYGTSRSHHAELADAVPNGR